MFVGHKRDLLAALQAIRAGRGVNVTGERGSGRTSFLLELQRLLRSEEWQVIPITGLNALKRNPLAAMHLAGVLADDQARGPQSALKEAADELRARTAGGRSVVVIDDWDDLDDASWGVVEAVRASTNFPVAISRSPRRDNLRPAAERDTSSINSLYAVDLPPARADDLASILTSRLGANLASDSFTRVFAMSSGNIGFALQIIDAAVYEDRLKKGDDGLWHVVGELWNRSLRTTVGERLGALTEPLREALGMFALAGPIDIDDAEKLVGRDTLEALEDLSLLVTVRNGATYLVTVTPAILTDYFRHLPRSIRLFRLATQIIDRLGADRAADYGFTARINHQFESGGRDALFAGLFRERVRSLVASGAELWGSSRTPVQAVPYLQALYQLPSAQVRLDVERVLAETDRLAGDARSRARFLSLYARWLAYADGELDKAVALLRSESSELGPWGQLLQGTEVEILTQLNTPPSDWSSLLQVSDDLPAEVAAYLLEVQMLIMVSSCRFDEALSVHQEIQRIQLGGNRAEVRVLYGLALLGRGEYASALRSLEHGLDEAREHLDLEAFRLFAAATATCFAVSGDYSGFDALMESVLAAGAGSEFPPGAQLALLSFSSLLASRLGNVALAEQNAAAVQRSGFQDGPLAGQSTAWTSSQVAFLKGDTVTAANELWGAGEKLWERNAYFAAATCMLISVELQPMSGRLDTVRSKVEHIPEAASLLPQLHYVDALASHDPEQMFACAAPLEQVGRLHLAVVASSLAAAWFGDVGDEEAQRSALAFKESVHARSTGAVLGEARFAPTAATLSDREREVALLAADGLSNHDIAQLLFITTRTVESHMLRVLKKLNLASRSGLREIRFLPPSA